MKRYRVAIVGCILITDPDPVEPDTGLRTWERTIDAFSVSGAHAASLAFFERHILNPRGENLNSLDTLAVAVSPG